MDSNEEPVEIDVELHLVTAASVWILRPDRYMRLPRDERPRQPPSTGILADGIWHPHRGVWRVTHNRGVYYRIVPADRPADARGVHTGDVIADSTNSRSPEASYSGTGPEQAPANSRASRPRNGT